MKIGNNTNSENKSDKNREQCDRNDRTAMLRFREFFGLFVTHRISLLINAIPA